MEEHSMPVVQIALEISDKIAAGLASGDYVRHAGTIRRAGGAIVEHLPEAAAPLKSVSKASIVQGIKDPKVLAVLGIGLLITAGVATWVATRKTDDADAGVPESVQNYDSALSAYLIAVQSGSMKLSLLNNLIASLDSIQQDIDSSLITIESSDEQTTSLLSIVRDYTIKLAEANNADVGNLPATAPTTASESIQILRRYLGIQKKIIEEAQ